MHLNSGNRDDLLFSCQHIEDGDEANQVGFKQMLLVLVQFLYVKNLPLKAECEILVVCHQI